MTDIDMSAYKTLYLETAREYIETLKKNLALLQQNNQDKEAIYEVLRSYHSLKSQSHAMGYQKTADFCKLMEDYFHEIHDGKKTYDVGHQTKLLETVAAIEQSVNSIQQTNAESDFTDLTNSLKTTVYANPTR